MKPYSAVYAELERPNIQKLEALPNVSTTKLITGKNMNDNRVMATLPCDIHWFLQCNTAIEQRQPKQSCNRDIPTRAHAAEVLMAKILESHSECIEYMHQGSSSTGSSTVHDRLRMAQVTQQTAERQAEVDEAAAEEARTAESTTGYCSNEV
jgi:hypothetical protein